MATTSKGLRYPLSSDHTRLWEHFEALAADVDLRYPQTFDSDGGFPVAVSGVTVESVLDRYTITAVPWARRFTLQGHVWTFSTQTGQEQDVLWYAGGTVIGRARGNYVATIPITLAATGQHDLAANTAVVFEMRIARASGTGTMSTSVSSGLTATTCFATPS